MTKPRVLSAGTKTAGQLCSICQTAIVGGELIVYCPTCELPYHAECWDENRGCAQYGCKSAPETVKGAAAPERISSVWGGEKKCPACGKAIKAAALKCRFCGASFSTRDQVSARDYARREYEGPEYTRARNKVVGLFLASATGCLSPLALIFCALLIFRGRFAGVEYRRLPLALKAVAICGFWVNCLLVFLLLLFAIFD